MEQEELIVGQWYDFRGEDDGDKIAAKYERRHSSTTTTYFDFTEYIRRSDGWKARTGNWYMPKTIIKADVSLISQYIPEQPETIINSFPLY